MLPSRPQKHIPSICVLHSSTLSFCHTYFKWKVSLFHLFIIKIVYLKHILNVCVCLCVHHSLPSKKGFSSLFRMHTHTSKPKRKQNRTETSKQNKIKISVLVTNETCTHRLKSSGHLTLNYLYGFKVK